MTCVEYRWHIYVKYGSKRSDGPEVRALEGARTRHQRPCRSPLRRTDTLGLALWATPGLCTRSTPARYGGELESTADDHLTVDSDANVCAGAKQKVSAVSLGV